MMSCTPLSPTFTQRETKSQSINVSMAFSEAFSAQKDRIEWQKEMQKRKKKERTNILPINNKFLFYFFSIYNLELRKKKIYPL